MSDIVTCPHCMRKLRVRPELQGQEVKCPACSKTFRPQSESPLPDLELDKPPPPRGEDRDLETTPRKRRDDAADDLDEDRPARRRREEDSTEDEDEDRPRRRRRVRYERDHRGGLILAFGICSFLVCQIFGPIAWVMGHSDLNEIRAGNMDPEGESLTRVGMILGIVSTVLMLVVLLLICLGFGIAAVNQ